MPPPGTTVPLPVYEAYRATGNYVSADGRTVQYSVGLKAGDPGTTAAMNAVPAVRTATTQVGKAIGAADSGVGGEAPALYDISSISNSDLVRVIPIAILAIGILLALVLRSLIAPLYLIASVGLSYLAALGLAVLLFVEIGGSGGLVFFLPFLMFIFLLALGEDYNILVMTRIREEAQRLPLRRAVSRALSVTGTTVTSAGLILAGTFVVFGVVAGRGSGGERVPRHRLRAGARHPHGHLPGADAAGALHGRAAGPVELVAVPDEPEGSGTGGAQRRGGRRAGQGLIRRGISGSARVAGGRPEYCR